MRKGENIMRKGDPDTRWARTADGTWVKAGSAPPPPRPPRGALGSGPPPPPRPPRGALGRRPPPPPMARAAPPEPAALPSAAAAKETSQSVVIIETGTFLTRVVLLRAAADSAILCSEFPTTVLTGAEGKPPQVGLVGELAGKWVKYPMQQSGVITKFDDMFPIWSTAFDKVRYCYRTTSVVIVEHERTPRDIRERVVSAMFETYEAPAVCVRGGAQFALYETGLAAGCVVDVGHSAARASRIVALAPPHSGEGSGGGAIGTSGRLELRPTRPWACGGADITDRMMQLLSEKGIRTFNTTRSDRLIARDIVEKHCRLGPEIPAVQYEMPDGNILEIPGEVLIAAPEILFSPGSDGGRLSLTEEVLRAVVVDDGGGGDGGAEKCTEILDVVLVGGVGANLPGLAERLEQELNARLEPARRRAVVRSGTTSQAIEGARRLVEDTGMLLQSPAPRQQILIGKGPFLEHGAGIFHEARDQPLPLPLPREIIPV